ncbi:tyrosine-type recombinase/integrase [Streptomyces sp. SID4919]|uniref:tyrosine-type recombinase/integrase n=1 Tax=unclassified Streptomyces TaxID=2593676 RepID=UPI00082377AB|nr:site-specific integrase [Streptomyces sp. AmelKG-E11A]MYY13272.1 tyrosine-type recombinase/integrase [Streptomyces sp. SID4919]SCK39225.1 Site-specific recombinase XerD [Streptomyces sp. AmelKG-E11A]
MAEEKKRTRQPNGASSIYLGADGKWHGRVTVGVRADGKPDRRHIERKTRPEVTEAVRELERQRKDGKVRKAGQQWTVKAWLEHWVQNIAKKYVSENSYDGYEVDVRVHLVPGLGAHKLERLEPEHLEEFYERMQKNGSAAGTAHHVHRTIRVALSEAVRRGHVTKNVAEIAKAPSLDEEEIEPYTIEEIQSLLLEASKLRNSARWVIALALGLRQGEALGLMWEDVYLDAGYIRIRKNRLRPRYEHGCGDKCGRKPGYCPDRRQIRREFKKTKSRAGRRTIGLPSPLIKLLRKHMQEQAREKKEAGELWEDKGYVFAQPTGGPLIPNTDYHRWKQLLTDAGVRDGRLHDARHTAGTVLLLLGVPDVVVDAIMGWEPGGSARMRARYMHVTGPMLKNVAQQVGDALWGTAPETSEEAGDGRTRAPQTATETETETEDHEGRTV